MSWVRIPCSTKENDIGKKNCDWVIEQAREVKALLSYNSAPMIAANRVRALSAIETAMSSLRDLQAYIESV